MDANPGSAEARRDVWVSLYKLGAVTNDPVYYREALAILRELEASGRLRPADRPALARLEELSSTES